ncbi:hypothetical protein L9F63_008080, partial [Diploptera punctata]
CASNSIYSLNQQNFTPRLMQCCHSPNVCLAPLFPSNLYSMIPIGHVAFITEAVLSSAVVPEGTSHFVIENCTTLRVKSHTWEGHRYIQKVELFNITELIIESDAFSWNETLALDPNLLIGLTVNISNSTIPELPSFSFKGRLIDISLNNVNIGSVEAFAFASLHHTDKLELVNCVVKDFKAQAFKKFAVNRLHIIGGYFSGVVQSRTMLELEVKRDLFIDKLTVDTLKSSALIIQGPKTFRIRDSIFQIVEGEAFRIRTRGRTLIQNNVFVTLAKGAFATINADHFIVSREGLQDLRFENNTIQKFEDGCLIFDVNSYEPQLHHVILNESCSCSLLESWSVQLSLHSNQEQRKKRHNDPTNPANPFWCRNDNGHKNKPIYIRFYDFNEECVVSSGVYVFLIVIVTSALGLVVIILLVVFWWRRRRKNNQRRWINVPTSPNNQIAKSQKLNNKGNNVEKGNKREQDARITMVVPDGRTYRETELHVIVERTEPLLQPEYVDMIVNETNTKPEAKNYIETHH